jgi:hypothetical protein
MRRWAAINCAIAGAAGAVAAYGHQWAFPAAGALMALNGIVYMRKMKEK